MTNKLEEAYKEASKSGGAPDYMVTNIKGLRAVCKKLGKNFEEIKKLPNVQITGNLVEIFKKII